MGFGIQSGSIKNDIVSAIKKFFPADLLNRIDEIVAFQGLHDDQIKAIINKELESFKKELSEKNIESEIKEEVCNFIFKKIQFNNFGARQVIKTIQREIQTLVAEKILENQQLGKIEICVKDNNICVI
jgi:ATP-dependent Clp protease ATP-binding subunit ClpA